LNASRANRGDGRDTNRGHSRDTSRGNSRHANRSRLSGRTGGSAGAVDDVGASSRVDEAAHKTLVIAALAAIRRRGGAHAARSVVVVAARGAVCRVGAASACRLATAETGVDAPIAGAGRAACCAIRVVEADVRGASSKGRRAAITAIAAAAKCLACDAAGRRAGAAHGRVEVRRVVLGEAVDARGLCRAGGLRVAGTASLGSAVGGIDGRRVSARVGLACTAARGQEPDTAGLALARSAIGVARAWAGGHWGGSTKTAASRPAGGASATATKGSSAPAARGGSADARTARCRHGASALCRCVARRAAKAETDRLTRVTQGVCAPLTAVTSQRSARAAIRTRRAVGGRARGLDLAQALLSRGLARGTLEPNAVGTCGEGVAGRAIESLALGSCRED